ncbi:uncharacterized protein BT62DRAFT_938737 [Guyanagaster necrorhizus]|uniref:Uncharacterized protein n=1 Tax=Guyanagaster necrorhizus TaxID=856835 RepID=A0A9P7VFK5_9AGAR|nr:uncharacterized protein BT62DRAFT_938737 [Guyanagaster necrorhizus MCA 3950]KAG7439662.1 hypothetical protein BT62DRAFT_938737 [Guyanagaster necrorhizus MCA 3950]
MLLLIVSEAVIRGRGENRTISCACSHYFPSSTSGEIKVLEREAQRRKEERPYVEGCMDVEGEEGKRL